MENFSHHKAAWCYTKVKSRKAILSEQGLVSQMHFCGFLPVGRLNVSLWAVGEKESWFSPSSSEWLSHVNIHSQHSAGPICGRAAWCKGCQPSWPAIWAEHQCRVWRGRQRLRWASESRSCHLGSADERAYNCWREGHLPAATAPVGEQMVNNMDCGHSVLPLGTSSLPGCSMTKPAWGKMIMRILHAVIGSVHPLKTPAWPLSICHTVLPGEEK